MRAIRIVLKFAALGLPVVVLCLIAVHFSNQHSPTVDVLGSYFPAWMVCLSSGLALTFITHWIVQWGNLKPYVGPAPVIYSSLMIVFTFATWILFYQN
ncbi:MAG: hypothetical protein QOH39_3000 [Verrucomicrobiota bacterium]